MKRQKTHLFDAPQRVVCLSVQARSETDIKGVWYCKLQYSRCHLPCFIRVSTINPCKSVQALLYACNVMLACTGFRRAHTPRCGTQPRGTYGWQLS
jgi:hypothetical protein